VPDSTSWHVVRLESQVAGPIELVCDEGTYPLTATLYDSVNGVYVTQTFCAPLGNNEPCALLGAIGSEYQETGDWHAECS